MWTAREEDSKKNIEWKTETVDRVFDDEIYDQRRENVDFEATSMAREKKSIWRTE